MAHGVAGCSHSSASYLAILGVAMATIPFPEFDKKHLRLFRAATESKMRHGAQSMKNPFRSWKKPAIILAVAVGGAVTIAAGDNYFEVGKNLEIFNELYKDINIYYVDDVNPGELINTGIDAIRRAQGAELAEFQQVYGRFSL